MFNRFLTYWIIGFCSASPASFAAAAAQPNIIFILADDLGYGDLGCFGQEKIKTPRLDRLAAEGMKFTQFYSGNTVCAPSRAALLTAQHMGHTVVRGNGNTQLPSEPETLGKLMKAAGYRTSVIGKWGMGGIDTPGAPLAQGFDEFRGYLGQTAAHDHYPEFLFKDNEKWDIPDGTYSNDLFTTEAIEFIRRNKSNPFFLYLPYTLPHQKMVVPAEGEYAEKPWPHPERIKAAMITRLDHGIGLVLDELKAQGLEENTLVFFTSDNGPHTEGGIDPEFFNSNGPFRGIKRDLSEGGIRVPMIARWPGKIKSGVTSEQVWAMWDVMPTLLDIIGRSAPKGRDGKTMKAALLEGTVTSHDPLYWEFYERGFDQAVRKGDWKLHKTTSGTLELYDLQKDPGEEHNLTEKRPEVVMELLPLLTSSRIDSERFPVAEAGKKKKKQNKQGAHQGKAKQK